MATLRALLHRHRVNVAIALVLSGLAFSFTFYTFAAFGSSGCIDAGRQGFSAPSACETYWGVYALASLLPGLSAISFTLWAAVLRHLPYERARGFLSRLIRRRRGAR